MRITYIIGLSIDNISEVSIQVAQNRIIRKFMMK
jgi:hypothetical protein